MAYLVSGCSFTYGDELEDPITQRWSHHLSNLTGERVDNVSFPGASNKYIWRSIKEKLLRGNDYERVIVLWSDIARFEALDMKVSIQYDTNANNHVKRKDGELNPEKSLDLRWDNPWIQLSPARLNSHPYRLKKEEMTVFYDKIYSAEGGLLDTLFYMKDVYNTCDGFGIQAYGGAFHEGVRFGIKRMFSTNRQQMLGPRLDRIKEIADEMLSGFKEHQLIGLEGSNIQSFNEFTKNKNYEIMPEGHPGPEAHEAYAHYLYKELKL